jgi:hypothetical protein
MLEGNFFQKTFGVALQKWYFQKNMSEEEEHDDDDMLMSISDEDNEENLSRKRNLTMADSVPLIEDEDDQQKELDDRYLVPFQNVPQEYAQAKHPEAERRDRCCYYNHVAFIVKIYQEATLGNTQIWDEKKQTLTQKPVKFDF